MHLHEHAKLKVTAHLHPNILTRYPLAALPHSASARKAQRCWPLWRMTAGHRHMRTCVRLSGAHVQRSSMLRVVLNVQDEPFTVGIAFWPATSDQGTIAAWGNNTDGLNPCNQTDQLVRSASMPTNTSKSTFMSQRADTTTVGCTVHHQASQLLLGLHMCALPANMVYLHSLQIALRLVTAADWRASGSVPGKA